MPEILGKDSCDICKELVTVKIDKRGNPYYACGHCQTRLFVGASVAQKVIEQFNKKDGEVNVTSDTGNGSTAGSETGSEQRRSDDKERREQSSNSDNGSDWLF